MKFPTYQSQRNISTQVVKSKTSQADFSPIIQAGAEVVEQWDKAKTVAETNQAYNNIEQGTTDILQRASEDKDINNSEKYINEINKLRTSQSFTNKDTELRFQRIADSSANQATTKINSMFRNKYIKHQQGEIIRSQALNKKAFMSGEIGSKEINKGILKQNYEAGFISDSVYQKGLEDMNNWEVERAQQDVATNPEFVLRNIDKYGLDEVQKAEVRKDAEKLIQKNNKQKSIDALNIRDMSMQELTNIINSNISEKEKKQAIQNQKLLGNIDEETQQTFNMVATSPKAIDAKTNNAVLADLILELDTLNNSDTKEEEYLKGLYNLRNNSLKKQSNGYLSQDEAGIFYNEMNTQATRKKEAKALIDISDEFSPISYGYNDAFNYFKSNMPQEQSLSALRTYFNAISDKNYTTEEKEAIAYKIRKEENRRRLQQAMEGR